MCVSDVCDVGTSTQVTVTVPTLEVSVTTSSADIPPGVVQVGELVSVDGRMVLPEVH